MGESNTNPTVKPRFAYFHLTVFLSTLLSVFFFFLLFQVPSLLLLLLLYASIEFHIIIIIY